LGPARNTAYSERTARLIDGEIALLLDDAQQRVRTTLREQRPLLDALARLLLEQETVERDALQALVRAHAGGPRGPQPVAGEDMAQPESAAPQAMRRPERMRSGR
jgi:cell division protease FtsH